MLQPQVRRAGHPVVDGRRGGAQPRVWLFYIPASHARVTYVTESRVSEEQDGGELERASLKIG